MEQENDENVVKMTDICRACLTRSKNMKYLLENSDEMFQLLSKFAVVANLDIEIGFKYPSYLCLACEEKVLSFYEFQQHCQKSNDLVKEYLAVFEKQDTVPIESLSIISKNVDTLEEENIVQVSQNTTDILNSQYEEISNPEIISTCLASEGEKTEYNNKFQEELSIEEVFSVHNSEFSSKNIHEITEEGSQDNDNNCQVGSEKFDSRQSLENQAKTHLTCEFCCEEFLADELLENHKCTKDRTEDNRDFTGNLKLDSYTSQMEGTQDHVFTSNSPKEFKNFSPKEVPNKNKALQKMRLQQYSVEDVEKAISIVREKFYKHITCIFCSFTAITNRSLSVHVTRMHREYRGKWCSSCNQVIENQASHNQEVHYEDLKCPFCKKIKFNMGHFMEHLASHSAERLYKCNICHKSFISTRHLRIHRETHVKDRPFRCNICNRIFLQAKHLNSHLRAHKSSGRSENNDKSNTVQEKNIEDENNENSESDNLSYRSECAEDAEEVPSKPHNYCKDCNKKVRSLPSHYRKHHTKITPNSNEIQNLCPYCGKRFKTRSKLTVHIRIHTGETPYKCRYCDKRIKTRNILSVHERTHTGEKPYMCTVCGKCFAQSSVLNTHSRIHTGRPEQCKICEKRFCRPAELKLHMRKHTGEKPYKCDSCGQAFKQKSHLVEHTKTHNDHRPYKCEYCEKAFKSSSTLKCHLQIHTGQKPFKCSQCSYACRQPYSLTQHMIQHEKDKPQPDYPHRCALCQRNYATLAHLTAHHTRFHPDLKLESAKENFEKALTNKVMIPDSQLDHEVDQDPQNDYQMTQENQLVDPNQIETVESIENVDTIIIQTEIDDGEMKFAPLEIRFATLQDL